jgi:hypothetical protein
MSLETNLTDSEVLDSSSAELEFNHVRTEGAKRFLTVAGGNPSLPYDLTFGHQVIGAGINKRRRSMVRFDRSLIGEVDSDVVVVGSMYTVADIPIGNLDSYTEMISLLANLASILATAKGGATLAIDGTSPGADVLINGVL